MDKILKAYTTGLSTRRRREIKASVLMHSHSFFKACLTTYHETNMDIILHTLGRVVDTVASSMNFSKTIGELKYVRTRVKKYIVPVLDVVLEHLLLIQFDDSRGVIAELDYFENERKIKDFRSKSIIRLKLSI